VFSHPVVVTLIPKAKTYMLEFCGTGSAEIHRNQAMKAAMVAPRLYDTSKARHRRIVDCPRHDDRGPSLPWQAASNTCRWSPRSAPTATRSPVCGSRTSPVPRAPIPAGTSTRRPFPRRALRSRRRRCAPAQDQSRVLGQCRPARSLEDLYGIPARYVVALTAAAQALVKDRCCRKMPSATSPPQKRRRQSGQPAAGTGQLTPVPPRPQ
jgi:hypothetical protein